MTGDKKPRGSSASELARQIAASLNQERLVPRFVDSYVLEYERFGLQAHPQRYRELIAVLTREALLAMCAHAVRFEAKEPKANRGRKIPGNAKGGMRVTREQLLGA